jgi:hypothetical protein
MTPIDINTVTKLAFNAHMHGGGVITLEDLAMRDWDTKEHIAEIMKQVNAYIGVWEDTLMNIHDALNELRDREMSE